MGFGSHVLPQSHSWDRRGSWQELTRPEDPQPPQPEPRVALRVPCGPTALGGAEGTRKFQARSASLRTWVLPPCGGSHRSPARPPPPRCQGRGQAHRFCRRISRSPSGVGFSPSTYAFRGLLLASSRETSLTAMATVCHVPATWGGGGVALSER